MNSPRSAPEKLGELLTELEGKIQITPSGERYCDLDTALKTLAGFAEINPEASVTLGGQDWITDDGRILPAAYSALYKEIENDLNGKTDDEIHDAKIEIVRNIEADIILLLSKKLMTVEEMRAICVQEPNIKYKRIFFEASLNCARINVARILNKIVAPILVDNAMANLGMAEVEVDEAEPEANGDILTLVRHFADRVGIALPHIQTVAASELEE